MKTRSLFILLLTLLLLSLGCRTSPDPRGDEVRATLDSKEALDLAFEDYLEGYELDPFVLRGSTGPQVFETHLNRKVSAMENLLARFQNALTGEEYGQEPHTWATLRLAQLHLNLGCELQLLELPDGLTTQEKIHYRAALGELIVPLVAHARSQIEALEPYHGGTYAYSVDRLQRIFREEGNDLFGICERTVDYWASQ